MPHRRKVLCCFKDCPNPALARSTKCLLHRYRERCEVEGCPNQVYARQRCVRHGGKRQCQRAGCCRNVRTGTFCSKHNPEIDKQCTEEGCTRQAHARQKCVRHGGGRLCSIASCSAYARREGMCIRHHRLSTASTLDDSATMSEEDFATLMEMCTSDTVPAATPHEELAFIDELVNSAVFDHVVEYSSSLFTFQTSQCLTDASYNAASMVAATYREPGPLSALSIDTEIDATSKIAPTKCTRVSSASATAGSADANTPTVLPMSAQVSFAPSTTRTWISNASNLAVPGRPMPVNDAFVTVAGASVAFAYARREGMCIRHHRLTTETSVVQVAPLDTISTSWDDLALIDELVNSPVFDHLVKYSVGVLRA
ncbi:hypothetical protein ACHHYP_16829 [Achlya hypogyna]|uniref:Uncharacterized protein n=1 Tax=Achlya hypogyna TaxID=1202772 RepID=A0A1V9Y5P4_ACHHY|nr:hypothetical protein ACHHYP_16829 [Achlya hypogyna]